MDRAGRALRRRARAVRLRPDRHADVRAHRGVPAASVSTPTSSARRCTSSIDKGGRSLALRPEGTARSCARSCSTSPTPPWKVWYVAPNFRYERPQKGRYRQHWQLGVEVLGVDDPAVDVEVIALARRLLPDLGLSEVQLLVNSMGDAASRARVPRGAARVLARPRRAARRRDRSAPRRTRCACSTRSATDWQDMVERAPQIARVPHGRVARRTSSGPGGPPGARHRVRDRAPAGARLRLLHAHHVRVRERRARRGAERDRRRRPLRPAGRGDGRAGDARHRVRHRHRAGAHRL